MTNSTFQSDRLREECGVFGIIKPESEDRDPAMDTYNALFALQHRGQDSCGISICRDGELHLHKNGGLVPDVFDKATLSRFAGANAAIGHVRHAFSPTQVHAANAQPILVHHASGSLSLCYNGKLVNSQALRMETENRGGIFQTTNDAEVISYLIVREHLRTNTLEDAVLNAMEYMIGAFSIIILSKDRLIAARDPNGFRPLCIGKVGESYVFSSESCAIKSLGGQLIRDVEPGEVVSIADGQLHSYHSRITAAKSAFCSFEMIYFSRQDSIVNGVSVGKVREMAGRYLARRNTAQADLVIGVPDSGLAAAMGFARESGIPYGMGLMKNRYIARTFMQSQQWARERSLRIKLNAINAVVQDKRIILVDDSIVRGGTMARIVRLLRDAGASEVHVKSSAPPFLYPCHFGTAIPASAHLAAYGRSNQEICDLLGADSLQYLSVEDLRAIMSKLNIGCCDACFTGNYAVPVPKRDPEQFTISNY